jgi:hypothetical protein
VTPGVWVRACGGCRRRGGDGGPAVAPTPHIPSFIPYPLPTFLLPIPRLERELTRIEMSIEASTAAAKPQTAQASGFRRSYNYASPLRRPRTAVTFVDTGRTSRATNLGDTSPRELFDVV